MGKRCLTLGGFICKQPNGLYCRFSTIVDTITNYDMTVEDYIDHCKERKISEFDAIDTMENYLKPLDWIIERFQPMNDTLEDYEKLLKKIGCTEEYLIKLRKRFEDE